MCKGLRGSHSATHRGNFRLDAGTRRHDLQISAEISGNRKWQGLQISERISGNSDKAQYTRALRQDDRDATVRRKYDTPVGTAYNDAHAASFRVHAADEPWLCPPAQNVRSHTAQCGVGTPRKARTFSAAALSTAVSSTHGASGHEARQCCAGSERDKRRRWVATLLTGASDPASSSTSSLQTSYASFRLYRHRWG